MEFTDAHVIIQTRATRTLLKFCDDHNDSRDGALAPVRACLRHLEAGDVAAAYRAYKQVPFGGNGCFNDWLPPSVFPHENDDYVWGVFDALCTEWNFMMNLATKAS